MHGHFRSRLAEILASGARSEAFRALYLQRVALVILTGIAAPVSDFEAVVSSCRRRERTGPTIGDRVGVDSRVRGGCIPVEDKQTNKPKHNQQTEKTNTEEKFRFES